MASNDDLVEACCSFLAPEVTGPQQITQIKGERDGEQVMQPDLGASGILHCGKGLPGAVCVRHCFQVSVYRKLG